MNKKVVKRGLLPYLLLLVFFMTILMLVGTLNQEVHTISYGDFMKEVENKNVKEVNVIPHSRESVYYISGTLNSYKENESFAFNMPLTNETMVKLLDAEDTANFKLTTLTDPGSSVFFVFLINVLPTLLLIGLAFYFITRQMGSGNKSMDFGRSKAHLSGGNTKVTFKDVAGLDEEKEEMK